MSPVETDAMSRWQPSETGVEPLACDCAVQGDPVIERIWEARQPLRSTIIAPGAVLQVGVPLTLRGEERSGTGGPMRLHYQDGDQSLSVEGTFEYTVTLDDCTL